MPNPTVWQADTNMNFSPNVDGSSFVAAAPDGRFSWGFTEVNNIRNFAFEGNFTFYADIANDPTADAEAFGASAFLADGRVVTAWSQNVAGSGDFDIYFKVNNGYNTIFSQALGPTLANTTATTGNQTRPMVAGLATGNFVVAWNDVNDSKVKFQIFDIFGNSASGGVVTANPGVALDAADIISSMIVPLANGGFAIGYRTVQAPGGGGKFSVFDGLGIATATDIESTDSDFGVSGIAQLADGRIVVVDGNTAGNGIVLKFYTESGSPLSGSINFIYPGGALFLVDNPRVVALHDGRFMVFTSSLDENAAGSDVWGAVFKADGSSDGTPFVVNSSTSLSQSNPAATVLADGRVLVSWTSNETGNGDIFTKIYDPRESGLRGGASSFGDDWYGTAFSDTVFLGAGNDVFHGGGAADFIYGESGNDTLLGEASDDRIDGGTGIDVMYGGAGADIYWVDNLNDTTIENVGEGSDTVRATLDWTLAANVDKLYILGSATIANGNDLSNFIYGNANANQINGGLGADRMFGGAGSDFYYADSAGDLIFETIAGAGGGLFDHVFSSVNHTLSNNVEFLTLTGGGNINGTGNSLGNTISGNSGNNFIDGKAGIDTLGGNGGSDQFLFTTTLNASTNVDFISDFDPANDFLRLDDAIFTQIATGFLSAAAFHAGAAATTAAHRIIYNSALGDVFYDRDGLGGVAQVWFANIGVGTALTQADIFVF
ncbi:MAG: calcium-binding protein [Aestuariivirga sp.]